MCNFLYKNVCESTQMNTFNAWYYSNWAADAATVDDDCNAVHVFSYTFLCGSAEPADVQLASTCFTCCIIKKAQLKHTLLWCQYQQQHCSLATKSVYEKSSDFQSMLHAITSLLCYACNKYLPKEKTQKKREKRIFWSLSHQCCLLMKSFRKKYII